ncbi:uncharacterized protein LOC114527500 isoform X2 [Dendronephthya gigantea]|uniref:uncharacterized protein LOC114527500 isoform X2 n=1 Tax=Dendronephthya gigantea TaxID=151771 RepID=UPI00106902B2|nr:uncharacterized protein LOC114527500 isoform X2 [Dendronephthya gigantea]XP_028404976.1 uncharacterized protein LOC114527500 isoform X2 [Dendronephthya gigantea]XP_028404977.1 uncharacterized protein LOC114527500 isoform X2 [Dendronephthya gigantea]XP_028404978.1 uncharacterized protein LOC114527500 isoform X2 [Dendronephthya gigantea]
MPIQISSGEQHSFSLSLFSHGTSRISKSPNLILHMALLNFILGSVVWFAVGYTMAFGESQKGVIGSMNHALLFDLNEGGMYGSENKTMCTAPSAGNNVVMFEMTFAILGPAMVLITWSEYIKPSGAMLLMILWPLFIYYPLAHWIRGNGWLSNTVIDIAGGLTLYTTAGASHFLLTIITKRKYPNLEKFSLVDQYLEEKTKSRNFIFVFLGSLLTTTGWFCLNIGSEKAVDNSLVLLNTHLTAISSAASWVMIGFIYTGQSSVVDLLYGLMAGLAGSSSYCGLVEPWSSALIGCVIGLLSHGTFILVKKHVTLCFRENCVDGTFVFGIPGMIGGIAAGLFSKRYNAQEMIGLNGAFYSNPIQLPYQFLGIVVVISWSSLWTLILVNFIHSTVGLFILGCPEDKERHVSRIHLLNNKESFLKKELFKAAKNGDLQQLQELKKVFAVEFGLKDFHKKTALHYTSKNGDYVCTQFLLKQSDVDIHAKDRYGVTPLSEAVRKHRNDVIVLLLDNGASWLMDGIGELLCSYVESGMIEEVRRLHSLGMDLNSSDSHGRTALHVAVSRGNGLMVECLIAFNVQLNKIDCFGYRPLNYAEMHENKAISEILIRYGALRVTQKNSQQEICQEASNGNLRAIKHMVNNGVNVSYQDVDGKTALHVSCKSGQLDVVKFLINQPGINVNATDRKNNTPLTEAVVNMHNDVAEYLQLHGGEIEEQRMMHLICKAVKNQDKRLVKHLLQWFHGSKVTDLDGQSVCHVCVRNGDVDMLETLLKAGISFREVDFFGNTPLALALQIKCDRSMIKILAEIEEGWANKVRGLRVSVKIPRIEVPSKSKIRRRRTRRQTRVEVASGDFSDATIPEFTKSYLQEACDNHMRNCIENEIKCNDRMEDGRIGATTAEEVTLADIELMNRQRKLNTSRISDIITGEPQYV